MSRSGTLLKWKDLRRFGVGGEPEFTSENATFEKFQSVISGHSGCVNMEFRGKLWAGEINLGAVRM